MIRKLNKSGLYLGRPGNPMNATLDFMIRERREINVINKKCFHIHFSQADSYNCLASIA